MYTVLIIDVLFYLKNAKVGLGLGSLRHTGLSVLECPAESADIQGMLLCPLEFPRLPCTFEGIKITSGFQRKKQKLHFLIPTDILSLAEAAGRCTQPLLG